MTSSEAENIIRVENVSKSFGDFQALKGVSLDVSLGERVVICGPSGSGKSTLIRCINGLEEHQSGDIVVDGVTLISSISFEIVMSIGHLIRRSWAVKSGPTGPTKLEFS